jgi:hypothetical protein
MRRSTASTRTASPCRACPQCERGSRVREVGGGGLAATSSGCGVWVPAIVPSGCEPRSGVAEFGGTGSAPDRAGAGIRAARSFAPGLLGRGRGYGARRGSACAHPERPDGQRPRSGGGRGEAALRYPWCSVAHGESWNGVRAELARSGWGSGRRRWGRGREAWCRRIQRLGVPGVWPRPMDARMHEASVGDRQFLTRWVRRGSAARWGRCDDDGCGAARSGSVGARRFGGTVPRSDESEGSGVLARRSR